MPCVGAIDEREMPEHIRCCSENLGYGAKFFIRNILEPPGLKFANAENPISMLFGTFI